MAGESRKVIDHLIGSEGVTGKDDVFIAFFFSKGKVCVDIFIGIREAFIPGTDRLLLSGEHIDGFNLPECVVGLGIYEIDIFAVQGISDIVIKRVGIKVPVDAISFCMSVCHSFCIYIILMRNTIQEYYIPMG